MLAILQVNQTAINKRLLQACRLPHLGAPGPSPKCCPLSTSTPRVVLHGTPLPSLPIRIPSSLDLPARIGMPGSFLHSFHCGMMLPLAHPFGSSNTFNPTSCRGCSFRGSYQELPRSISS